MTPRPPPDLDRRRASVVGAARDLAESEGWSAVTIRRLGDTLGVTQPVIYSAFAGRQAILDAVALAGFDAMAVHLRAVEPEPLARMRVYLDFAADHPRVYEAMFSLPSGLTFAAEDTPEPLLRAFAGIREAFPDDAGVWAEVAWATLHGLATLSGGGRLPPELAEARLDLALRLLASESAESAESPESSESAETSRGSLSRPGASTDSGTGVAP